MLSARQGGSPAEIALGLLRVGLCEAWAGEFAATEAALDEAIGLCMAPEMRPDITVMVTSAQGALLGLRGDEGAADDAFARALAWVTDRPEPLAEAVVRTQRAEVTASWAPERANADARSALVTFERQGNERWATRACRSQAIAALACGEFVAADVIADDLTRRPANPLEAARARMLRGETRLRLGDTTDAADDLRSAAAALAALGARYWHVAALLLLAEADDDAVSDVLAEARHRSDRDPAYRRLWTTRPRLSIEVLGAERVTVGGEVAVFRARRSEALVFMLALAGPAGVPWESVCERLWPDALPASSRSRLRTAVWDARLGLGSEAWRLRRLPGRLVLELEGADLDFERARRTVGRDASSDRASRELVKRLEAGLLPGWATAAWVQPFAVECRAMVEQLQGASTIVGGPT